MRHVLRIAGLFLLAASISSLLPGQMFGGKATSTTVAEQYLFASANAERAQRGLGALRWDASLYQAADFHARAMAERASISHEYAGEPELSERARQAGAHFSVIAENVAEAPTAVRIHDAWMASEGHRANLLDPRLNAIGIRVLQRDGQLYAVEDFSRSVESLPLDLQERTVRDAVASLAPLTLLPTSADARRTCTLETGYTGTRRPGFVMRYTTTDLTSLPDSLRSELLNSRYHQAEIAACEGKEETKFSSYRMAVLLYP